MALSASFLGWVVHDDYAAGIQALSLQAGFLLQLIQALAAVNTERHHARAVACETGIVAFGQHGT